MKSGYKKDIYIYFADGVEPMEHRNDPFYPYNLSRSLDKYGAIYKGTPNEKCRGGYIYFLPEDKVYLTCIFVMECEYFLQIVYLEGDTEETVENAEEKLRSYLFNKDLKI